MSGVPQEQHHHYSSDFTVICCVWSLMATSLPGIFSPYCTPADEQLKALGWFSTKKLYFFLWQRLNESGKGDKKKVRGKTSSLTKRNITSPQVCFQLACAPPPCLDLHLWHQEGGIVSAPRHVCGSHVFFSNRSNVSHKVLCHIQHQSRPYYVRAGERCHFRRYFPPKANPCGYINT